MEALIPEAQKWAEKLGKIPSVEAIFLSGSLAQGSSTTTSDIDFFILTKPNQIWSTRFWVFYTLKRASKLAKPHHHSGQICPNHFITTDHLELEQKNPYTAHLFSHNVPLYDPKNYFAKFRAANNWVTSFGEDFKTSSKEKSACIEPAKTTAPFRQFQEICLKNLQIWKIKRNSDFQTPKAEIILTDQEIRFHPNPKHLNWQKNECFRKNIGAQTN